MNDASGRHLSVRAVLHAFTFSTSAIAMSAVPILPAQAQTAGTARTFSIAAQPLLSALQQFTEQSGIQVAYTTEIGSGVQSPGVSGSFASAEALSRLLTGTGLTVRFTSPRTVTLERAPQSADGTIQLGPVRVAGSDDRPLTPTSGQASPATTDGSRSYTSSYVTVAGKAPVNVREVPNTVTVVTRQRMDERNMLTAQDALKEVSGVAALSYSGVGDAHYSSRGFGMAVQYDGMPGATDALRGFIQFDLPVYDRLEVLKGPVGLLQGSTGIGGTINFARKKPRADFFASVNLQAGSWDFWHGDLDVTGPLNKSGTIRGRVVASGTNRDFFYHTAYSRRRLGYGVLEFDLTPATTLTTSVTHQVDRSILSYGIPTYSDGSPLIDVPRSTFVGAEWAKMRSPMSEYYADLRHDFAGGWQLRTAYTRRISKLRGKTAYALGTVDPDTMLGSIYTQTQRQRYGWDNADIYVTGPVELFGQAHQLLIGANYAHSESTFRGSDGTMLTGIDILDPQPVDPDLPITSGNATRTEQYGLYGQVRIKPAHPVTLVLGGRLSHFESGNRTLLPTISAWQDGARVKSEFTPYVGIIYDVTPQISLYASYADMFFPQTNLTASGETLKPEEGVQYEVGIKGQFFNETLNASIAYFNIRDRNRAITDPNALSFFVAQGEVENEGVEAEVSGNLTPAWDIVVGYSYTKSRFIRDPDNLGLPFDPRYPKHSFKLTTNYRFQDGPLSGLRLGGNLRVQGAADSGDATPLLRQDAFAVVDLQVGYQLTENINASVSVNNLFDKRYFDRLGFTSFFNWYGAPRNVTASIRASF